jgi:hypothetical protein
MTSIDVTPYSKKEKANESEKRSLMVPKIEEQKRKVVLEMKFDVASSLLLGLGLCLS